MFWRTVFWSPLFPFDWISFKRINLLSWIFSTFKQWMQIPYDRIKYQIQSKKSRLSLPQKLNGSNSIEVGTLHKSWFNLLPETVFRIELENNRKSVLRNGPLEHVQTCAWNDMEKDLWEEWSRHAEFHPWSLVGLWARFKGSSSLPRHPLHIPTVDWCLCQWNHCIPLRKVSRSWF